MNDPNQPASSPRLSICIPTYNRAEHLRECIESIFASIRAADAEAETELVISDNASPDHTKAVVEELIVAGYPIKYQRQQTNIGPHLNFRVVAELGTGQFVWVFGDDDKVEPAAVGRVLAEIKEGADAVICNGAVYDPTFKKLINPRFVKLSVNRTFRDPDEVLASVGVHLGWISGIIMDRKRYLNVPIECYMEFDKEGSCFMYSVYCVLRSSRNISFLADPIVLNRGGDLDPPESGAETRGNLEREDRAWNKVFAVGFPRALAALHESGYSRRAIGKAYVQIIFAYLLPRLMLLKKHHRPAGDLVKSAIHSMGTSWATWCFLVPAALLPGFALRRMRWLKRAIGG
jgi:glycosyltransferase involved in cell wall biosynthesis